MSTEQIVQLGRATMEATLWLAAPVLLVALLLSLLINIAQVLTSIQDATVAAVPRLAAVGVAIALLLPWMLRRLVLFTVRLFSDLRPYVR